MSSPQGRQAGSFGDELTNTLMIGLVALFGIESPGLTSSLAIGEAVAAMLQEHA